MASPKSMPTSSMTTLCGTRWCGSVPTSRCAGLMRHNSTKLTAGARSVHGTPARRLSPPTTGCLRRTAARGSARARLGAFCACTRFRALKPIWQLASARNPGLVRAWRFSHDGTYRIALGGVDGAVRLVEVASAAARKPVRTRIPGPATRRDAGRVRCRRSHRWLRSTKATATYGHGAYRHPSAARRAAGGISCLAAAEQRISALPAIPCSAVARSSKMAMPNWVVRHVVTACSVQQRGGSRCGEFAPAGPGSIAVRRLNVGANRLVTAGAGRPHRTLAAATVTAARGARSSPSGPKPQIRRNPHRHRGSRQRNCHRRGERRIRFRRRACRIIPRRCGSPSCLQTATRWQPSPDGRCASSTLPPGSCVAPRSCSRRRPCGSRLQSQRRSS